MKVDPTGPARSAPPRRKDRSGRAAEADFASELPAEAEGAAGGSAGAGAQAVGGVGALLALQEVPDAANGRARAKRRGEELLDRLDELRLALIAGRLATAQVERLAARAKEARERVDDPRLEAVVQEIELRAAVELAKLRR